MGGSSDSSLGDYGGQTYPGDGGGRSGAGGTWGSDGYTPGDPSYDPTVGVIGDNGFGSVGLAGDNDFSGDFGGSANDYGVPRDWLSGVTGDGDSGFSDYLNSNYNDYGIPRDWLLGATGGLGSGPASDYGVHAIGSPV